MWKAISRVFFAAIREVKMYNIEKRAHDAVSKEKPTPAPKHPATIKEMELLEQEKISKDYLLKKNEKLDEYLKKVYVTSLGPAPALKREQNPNRPLPLQRRYDFNDTLYGYSQSEEVKVPEGQVSLKQALTFIADHQSDKEKFSNKVISEQYKLPANVTDDILEHFKTFRVHVNKKEVDPAQLSSLQRLQKRVTTMTLFNVSTVAKELKHVLKKKPEDEANATPVKDVKDKSETDKNSSSIKKDGSENR